MSFTIRKLRNDDFSAMEEMFYCVFPPSEKDLKSAFHYRVQNLSKGIYLDSGELAGFLLCDVYGPSFELIKIQYIVVHPAYQKLGFGSILLEHLLGLCRKMKKNVTLIPVMRDHILAWYRKKGFRITKVCDASNGGKLYEMTCTICA